NFVSYACSNARNGPDPTSAVIRPEPKVRPSTHSRWSESCWRTNGSSPEGGANTGTIQPALRAARTTWATVEDIPHTSRAVAPARRACSTWGAGSDPAGTPMSAATDEGFRPNAWSNAAV